MIRKLEPAIETIEVSQDAWTDEDGAETPAPDYKLNEYDDVDSDDRADYLTWQTVELDYDGLLSSNKVYTSIDRTTPFEDDVYTEATYEYDKLGRNTKATDPEGLEMFVFYRIKSITIDSVDHELLETRVYPTHDDSPYQLAGPISVAWIDEDGNVMRRWTATETDSLQLTDSVPNGTDALSESEYRSRTSYLYDWRGRLSKTRVYHSIMDGAGTEDDYGTEGTNYYETEVLAYDEQNRLLRQEDGLGTITAQVYDGVGRATSLWVGTSLGDGDYDDLRTDPGDGTSNLIKVKELFYDSNGATAGGDPVPELRARKRLDATTTETWVTDSFDPYYDLVTNIDVDQDGTDDGTFRVGRAAPAEGPLVEEVSDGVINVVSRTRNSVGSNYMLTMVTSLYEAGDRKFADRQYAVNPGTGSIVAGSAIDTAYTYDDAGRQDKVFMPSGGFTETVYDDAGRATNVVVWSDGGTPATGTDNEAIEERVFTYDDVGNVTREAFYRCDDDAYSGGGSSYLLSDATNGAASQVSYVYRWYDDGHRLSTVADYGVRAADPAPGSEPTQSGATTEDITAYGYDAAGRQETVTDNTGVVTKGYFDDMDRVEYVVENYYPTTAIYWDTEPSDPKSRTATPDRCRITGLTYNALDQLLTRVAVDPDADGALTDNQTTTYTYGDTGSNMKREDFLLSIEYPDDSTNKVQFAYFRNGLLRTRTDQRGVPIAYDYDEVGKLLSEDVGTYAGGDVDLTVDEIVRTYDAAGRLESVTSEDSGNTALNGVLYVYDYYGNLDKEHQDHAGAAATNDPCVDYTYDSSAGNRLTSITYPGPATPRVVNYDYGTVDKIPDRLSLVASIKPAGDAYATYKRVGLDTIVEVDHPALTTNGLTLTFGSDVNDYDGLDNMGRAVDVTWKYSAGATHHDRFEHTYDGGGNRLTRDVMAIDGPPADNDTVDGHDFQYAYDDLNRLTAADRGTLEETTFGTLNRGEDWELDQSGNWTGYDLDVDGDGDITGATDLEQTRQHNRANEIDNDDIDTNGPDIAAITERTSPNAQTSWASPGYDKVGNMDIMPVPGAEDTTYAMLYDAWNRLTEVSSGGTTVAEYRYDGSSRRTAKLKRVAADDWTRTDYYYDTDWRVVEERRATGVSDANRGNTATTLYAQYVWGLRYIDAPVLRDRNTTGDEAIDETLYFCNDANMNVTALVRSDTGRVAERYEYTPYGYVIVLDGDPGTAVSPGDADGTDVTEWDVDGGGVSDWDNEVLFTGYRYDPESGLYHVRLRYYHPTLGRWLTRNPLEEELEIPERLNLYAYVMANPINFTDSSGGNGSCAEGGYVSPTQREKTPKEQSQEQTGGPTEWEKQMDRIMEGKEPVEHHPEVQ